MGGRTRRTRVVRLAWSAMLMERRGRMVVRWRRRGSLLDLRNLLSTVRILCWFSWNVLRVPVVSRLG